MSAPLPDLPTDPELEVHADVLAMTVHGRLLWIFPYRLPETASRGRRYRLRWDSTHAVRVLVRLGDRTACRPVGASDEGERFTVAMRALANARPRRIPEDLSMALRDAELDLGELPDGQVQQLVFMVTEARDPAIRAQRVRIAVDAVRQAR